MKKITKTKAMLVSLLVVACAAIGGTVAYLATSTDPVTNNFEYGNVPIFVEETFENNVKSDVTIKNEGNVDAYIRAAIIVTWQDESGNVYWEKPVEDDTEEGDPESVPDSYDYRIVINNTDWINKNGYYYYPTPVAPDHSTPVLINSCVAYKSKSVGGTTYYLNVDIVAESIQAEPDSVVGSVWSNSKVIVSANDGTLTVTERTKGGLNT